MRYSGRAALLAVIAILFAGCMNASEEKSVPPLSDAGGHADPGLGPGTHPLSSGPGYKGSPSWSPQGDRIAFTIDGYVADKPLDAGRLRRWKQEGFVAEDTEWASEGSLAILGSSTSGPVAGTDAAAESLYQTRAQEDSLDLAEGAKKVLAMSPGTGGNGLIVALETAPHESELALMQGNGAMDRSDARPIEGRVTGISLSPDGRRAALAVRARGDRGPSELHVMDLKAGSHSRLTQLRQGLEILGAPQWTTRGICYVAGKAERPGSGGSTPLYNLYFLPSGSDTPEHTPGVGEDFIASGIRVSPDGERLAVIGRLNPNSPINLYVLDMEADDLVALTSSEDMEIKTGPDDLAWSPDGESVAIVARGALSEEPRVRAAPADTLLEDFYNLYEIPVDESAAP